MIYFTVRSASQLTAVFSKAVSFVFCYRMLHNDFNWSARIETECNLILIHCNLDWLFDLIYS